MPSRKRQSKRKSKRQGVSRKKCKTCSRSRKVVRRRSSTNLRGGANSINVPNYLRIFAYTENHYKVLEILKDLPSADLSVVGIILVKQIIDYYNISKRIYNNKEEFSKMTVGLCKALNDFRDCYYIGKIRDLHKQILDTDLTTHTTFLTNMFKTLDNYKMIAKLKKGLSDIEDDTDYDTQFDSVQQRINSSVFNMKPKELQLQFLTGIKTKMLLDFEQITNGQVSVTQDVLNRLSQEFAQIEKQIQTLTGELQVLNQSVLDAYAQSQNLRSGLDTYVNETMQICTKTLNFIASYPFQNFRDVTTLTIANEMVNFFVFLQNIE